MLAAVAAATSLRLHAWFTAQYFPADLPAQQAWTRDLKRWCDLVFASLLIVAAFVIAAAHPEFAMLLVAVATATLVASLIIEPTTAQAAFPPPAGSSPSGRT